MAVRTTNPVPMLDELLERLGGVSLDRICMDPPPGEATEADVIRLYERHKRLFELVDGTLVEKVMGAGESSVAGLLIQLLRNRSDANGKLGMVLGEAGTVRLLKRLVRIPDVSFTRWGRIPGGKVPREPIPDLAPDLAVEVLSRKNTRREIERKLKEYFLSGVELVWIVDPRRRTVRVYETPDEAVELDVRGVLDGGDILPGLRIPVADLFSELADEPTTRKPGKKTK